MNTMPGTAPDNTEARLRAEFTRRAANATGAERIRAALADPPPADLRPYRDRRHRTGGWIAVAAGVAVVAAGIPIGLHLAGDAHGNANPAREHDIVYHMTYQPTWLPPGYLAGARESSVGSVEQTMTWYAPVDMKDPKIPPSVSLEVSSTATSYGRSVAELIKEGGEEMTTTVNGHPASVMDGVLGYTTIDWQPSPDIILSVSASDLDNALPIVRRMAESVVPDNSASVTVTAGLTFGHLPTGYQPFSQAADGMVPPTVSSRTIKAADGPATSALQDLKAEWNPKGFHPPLPDGPRTPVVVRGTRGTYIDGKDSSVLSLQLPDGSLLTITSAPVDIPSQRPTPPRLTEEQLVAVANGITVDPDPDTSWLGH